MKALFALAVLALNVVAQTPSNSGQSSGLQIVEISFTKKFIRERGLSGGMVRNDPPVLDNSTIMIPGGGSTNRAVINKTEKATISSSARSSNPSHVSVVWDWKGWVYNFEAQVKNTTAKTITRFVWAYTIPSEPDSQETVGREYLCRVRIEPGETKRIKVRSPIPRSKTVDASDASKPPVEHEPTLADMAVNQVEFDGGTLWRRANWNPVVLTRLGARKLGNGKCITL